MSTKYIPTFSKFEFKSIDDQPVNINTEKTTKYKLPNVVDNSNRFIC